jgi:alkanesulfonate monooxygenase SsuD/methylene tetrahydromethanopterin reductase-like flavin-dependent oxidoreductase (luciferase family)
MEKVSWSGRHRPAMQDAGVYPRPVQDPLPIWLAVGGTPNSIVRAASLGLPLALAIIGGAPERFVQLVNLYRKAATEAGHPGLPVGINSHTYVADTAELVVGSPQEVVEKVLFQHELFGHQRFMAQVSVGHLPHAKAMRAIELLGTQVAPAVRAELDQRSASASAASA